VSTSITNLPVRAFVVISILAEPWHFVVESAMYEVRDNQQ